MRWCLAVVAAACAGPRPASAPSPAPPVARVPELRVAAPEIAAAPGFGPEILRPEPRAGDLPVAEIGGLVLRRSDAFARLLTADPKLALSAVDLLVFDVLVANHAEQFGIRVGGERIAAAAAAEAAELREQVARELGRDYDFAAYVERMFGMSPAVWQQSLALRAAQRLYQGYVIRYLALREDRAQVRFVVHKDRRVVAEVVDKVRGGADFATLATRWSEDATRRDGGLLPPFGRSAPHPAAGPAFTLEPGQVSEPLQAKVGDEVRWFCVYCLSRSAGRDVPFAAVADEIDRDLQERPLTNLETSAYTLRWRTLAEQAPSAGERR
jgi:parvulin-like peptidyl-prolyl isomerase